MTGAGPELSITGAGTVAGEGTDMLSGATFNTASLTVGSLAGRSGALVVSGIGSVVNLAGALNIGTSEGTGDIPAGPSAMVSASVVNPKGQEVLGGDVVDTTAQPIGQGMVIFGVWWETATLCGHMTAVAPCRPRWKGWARLDG